MPSNNGELRSAAIVSGVLAVGGIREKSLAARRLGIHTVVIPERNHADLQDIPKKLRQNLTFVEIRRIDEVIDRVLLPATP